MPYPIERKLVVGVSSNALFDLTHEDQVFKNEGLTAYRKLQIEKRDEPLNIGVAYPFIRRFLAINNEYSDEKPVEVVLLSKNSPESGLRIFKSIEKYNLDISRAAFTSGKPPYEYIPPFNISLFLSTDNTDVRNAIESGYPAGRFIRTSLEEYKDDKDDRQLIVAFDFDGVIADDQAERVYQEQQQLDIFHQYEVDHVDEPHGLGPLADFFKKISFFQKMESKKAEKNSKYHKILHTAIITARNAPAHERAIKTLSEWDVTVDEMLLLGGIEKRRFLEVMKPHIYFDDQMDHLDSNLRDIPLVHIPFGIKNKPEKKK